MCWGQNSDVQFDKQYLLYTDNVTNNSNTAIKLRGTSY